MILKECVDSKYAAQAVHYKQTGGDPVQYGKLLQRKYKETLKRRTEKHEQSEAK